MGLVLSPEEATSQLLKKLIDKYNDSDGELTHMPVHLRQPDPAGLPAYLAKELNQIEIIKSKIRELDRKDDAEEVRHTEVLLALAEERTKVQKSCDHLSTTYHGDASGNNDSHYECNICGLYASRIPSKK